MAAINPVAMREKEDPLGMIVKGLQIAGSIYGIRTDMNNIEDHQKKVQDQEKLDKGILNKQQQVELAPKFSMSPNLPAGTEGQDFQTLIDEQTGNKIYVTPRKDTSPMFRT